jgi:hypothetical protein
MIAIDHVLLSDDLVQEEFVCDLNSCQGGCCVEGDCGAPLTGEEAGILAEIYPRIKSYFPEASNKEIERVGTHVMDDEFGYVTPAINGGICVYAYTEETGIVKCGIEKAWKEGVIPFQKPISCHLYPIRVKEGDGYEMINYEPRKKLCKPACKLGRQLKVPVYKFLRDPIIRKYGPEFYEALDAVGNKMRAEK